MLTISAVADTTDMGDECKFHSYSRQYLRLVDLTSAPVEPVDVSVVLAVLLLHGLKR